MACRLFRAKPLSKPMLGYIQFDTREKFQRIFTQNIKIFIHENASENIACEMEDILAMERWVILSWCW